MYIIYTFVCTSDILFATHLFSILARAKALEIQQRKDGEALKAKIAKKKEDEALAKALQAAKDRAVAIEQQRVLKEAEEARAKRELEELEAKIARERKKAAEERAVAKEREKKLAEKKIAEEKAAAIKEATMMEKIAKKDLEEAIARIEHARQVKMEVNEKFKMPSKGPSKSSNKMELSIEKQSKIPEISESRSEIEDANVNVSSIEMDNARDVAPGVVDPEPEIMKQQILKLQSLISELKQPENPEVMKQEILQSLLSELKQSRYEDDEGLFSSLFKWPACFWEDLTNSSFDGSDYSTREGCRFTMVFS